MKIKKTLITSNSKKLFMLKSMFESKIRLLTKKDNHSNDTKKNIRNKKNLALVNFSNKYEPNSLNTIQKIKINKVILINASPKEGHKNEEAKYAWTK